MPPCNGMVGHFQENLLPKKCFGFESIRISSPNSDIFTEMDFLWSAVTSSLMDP